MPTNPAYSRNWKPPALAGGVFTACSGMNIRRQLSKLLRRRFDGALGPDKPAWRKMKIKRFKNTHGYWPNLDQPRAFSEKLLVRILNQRDPFYPLYANKLMAPHFAQMLMGEKTNLYHAKRYKILHQVMCEDLHGLPEGYAIKGMYAAGRNILVFPGGPKPTVERLNQLNQVVREGHDSQNVLVPWPGIVIEELLLCRNGKVPDDLRFHCFAQPNGQPHVILQIDRTVDGAYRRSFYDASFKPLDFMVGPWSPPEVPFDRPDMFDEALTIAKRLSKGFDYIRVDLYDVNGRIYFGEFTPFNATANARFAPQEWDERLGALWEQSAVPYTNPQGPFVDEWSLGPS